VFSNIELHILMKKDHKKHNYHLAINNLAKIVFIWFTKSRFEW